MNRETKVAWVLLLTASVLTAVVMLASYVGSPVVIYQVPAAAYSAPPLGEDSSEEEMTESAPQGPQPVLVEHSVNLNSASLEELDQLPGVGPVLAQRIVDYREANGGFYDVEELMEVSGIGEKTYARLEPYLTVG